MNKKINCYKVPCEALETVLLIKKFTAKEEAKLYNTLKSKISDATKPIDVDSFIDYVIEAFLCEGAGSVEQFEMAEEVVVRNGDVLLKKDVKKAVYECILLLYPPFRLENLCMDVNNDLFMGDALPAVKHLFESWKKHEKTPEKLSAAILSKEEIETTESFLRENLVGQSEAIDGVVDTLKLFATSLQEFASLMFIGPTGVGKTYLAKLLGERFSGNFLKINCGEFSSGHEYSKLIGAPPGYVGHTDKSLLAEKADVSNKWVILFDEVEKAHEKFLDFLLSLLDDGTVTDNLGQVLDFSKSIFIFTSNQGLHESKIGEHSLGFNSHALTYDEVKEDVISSMRKKFSPEFLNRIDRQIFFNSLKEKEVLEIASLEMEGLPLKKTKKLLNYIVDGGYSEEYGARNIARFIKNNISIKVADAILDKKVPLKSGALYTARLVKGELQIIGVKDFKEKSNGMDAKEKDSSAT